MWLSLALSSRLYKKRQVINVDEFGLVTIQPAEDETAAEISSVLRAPQVAGTFVSPKGQTKRTVIGVAGGEVGGVFGWIGKTIGSLVTDLVHEGLSKRRARKNHEGQASPATDEGAPPLPPLDTGGYVAISADEVVIIQVHPHLRKVKIGPEVVGHIARSAVASAELDRGRRVSVLRIGFVGGGWSEFEVARLDRDTAEQVVHALGGRVR